MILAVVQGMSVMARSSSTLEDLQLAIDEAVMVF